MLFEVEPGELEKDYAKAKTFLKNRKGLPVCHVPLTGRNKLFLPMSIKAGLEEVVIRIDGKETDIVRV